MNERDFTIKFNAFELGVITGVIMKSDDKTQRALHGIWEQLIAFKKEVEQQCGVKKEVIPGGMLKITDADGNIIIRPPYPYEIGDN